MEHTQATITEIRLASMANCPLETIRMATRNGVLCVVGHADDGAPLYLSSSTLNIQFFLHAKHAGFSEREIRMMMAMIEMFGGDEGYVEEVIADRLRAIASERERILAAEGAVQDFISWCHEQPNGFASLATFPKAANRGLLS